MVAEGWEAPGVKVAPASCPALLRALVAALARDQSSVVPFVVQHDEFEGCARASPAVAKSAAEANLTIGFFMVTQAIGKEPTPAVKQRTKASDQGHQLRIDHNARVFSHCIVEYAR
jgi:hypothetical protein